MSSWKEVDNLIVNGRVIQAMQTIRELQGCGLKQAVDTFHKRYLFLRDSRPEDFTVPPEEYGRGVYS